MKLTLHDLIKLLQNIPNQMQDFEKVRVMHLYEGMPEAGWYLYLEKGDPYNDDFELVEIKLGGDEGE